MVVNLIFSYKKFKLSVSMWAAYLLMLECIYAPSKMKVDKVDKLIERFHGNVAYTDFVSDRFFTTEESAMRLSKAILNGALLSEVVEAGEFRDEEEAVSSLVQYRTDVWDSISQLDIMSQVRFTGHPAVAKLLLEYTHRNTHQCMFNALPPSLQKRYDEIFTKDPDMKLEVRFDYAGKLTLNFPGISEPAYVIMHDDRYGQLSLPGVNSWSFDLVKKCIVMNKGLKVQLLPGIRSALEIESTPKAVRVHLPRSNFQLDHVPRSLEGFASPLGLYISADQSLLVCRFGNCKAVASNVIVAEVDGDFVRFHNDLRVHALAGEASMQGGLRYHYNRHRKDVLSNGDVSYDHWGYMQSQFHRECEVHRLRLDTAPRNTAGVSDLRDACAKCHETRETGVVSDEFKRAAVRVFNGRLFSPFMMKEIFLTTLYRVEFDRVNLD